MKIKIMTVHLFIWYHNVSYSLVTPLFFAASATAAATVCLIFFSACKSNDLCCNVCTELLLACAVLDSGRARRVY